MPKEVKKRNWAFVLYPESAPSDWRERLQKRGVVCAVSPLHDQDVNADGEVKKAHYHVITCYEGPTTFRSVKSLTDELNCPAPQPLDSVKGYYRYLTHKDNPEKYQYNENNITVINGFNIADYTDLTRREIEALKRDIIKIIREQNILEYSHLIDFLLDNDRFDLSDIASNNTIFFNNYITSKRNCQKEV